MGKEDSSTESVAPNWNPERPDGSSNIWRYMTFPKFVSLLSTESLWFNSAWEFDDPYEGALPLSSVEKRTAADIQSFDNGDEKGIDAQDIERVLQNAVTETYSHIIANRTSFVSCWHRNSTESTAMWSLYSSEGKGIAIQTTVDNFADSIQSHSVNSGLEAEESKHTEQSIQLGNVEYIEYAGTDSKQSIPDNDHLAPLFHKRKSFSHEKEFRAVYREKGLEDNVFEEGRFNQKKFNELPKGTPVSVDLDELIETVYIAPDSPDWFEDSIEAVVHSFGRDFDTKRSSLERSPLF